VVSGWETPHDIKIGDCGSIGQYGGEGDPQAVSSLTMELTLVTSETLLAHVVSRFAPRQWENVATESLRYLLARPAGQPAIQALLAPLGFEPGHLTWRAQASATDDSSIPDLVGNDAQGHHVLIVEGKFWASLTENQPITYLNRQSRQFPDAPSAHLLMFLVPRNRVELISAELEARLGARHTMVGPFTVLDRDGRRVVVVSWGHGLAQLQVAFEDARDEQGIADLAQLRGLCDRADVEAVLPIAAEEVGSDRGRRLYDFCDLVDQATNALVATGAASTRGLRATAGKGWYGRGIRAQGGTQLSLMVSAWGWGTRYPTPWWIRIWPQSRETAAAVRALESDPGIGYIGESQDGTIEVGIQPPLGVEGDAVRDELVRVTGTLCAALPPVDDSSATHSTISNDESPTESDLLSTADEIEPR
jgi:hypothetical protein